MKNMFICKITCRRFWTIQCMPVNHDGAIRFIHLQQHIQIKLKCWKTHALTFQCLCSRGKTAGTCTAISNSIHHTSSRRSSASSKCCQWHRRQRDKLTWMPFWEVTTSRSREGRTQNAAWYKKITGFLYFYDTVQWYSMQEEKNKEITLATSTGSVIHLIGLDIEWFCFYFQCESVGRCLSSCWKTVFAALSCTGWWSLFYKTSPPGCF